MAQEKTIPVDVIMTMLNMTIDERHTFPDDNMRFEMDGRTYHAINLGKNRLLADPAFAYGIHRHPALEAARAIEVAEIQSNGGQGVKPGSRAWCAMYGHGRDAMWPPMDPGKPHKEMRSALERHVVKMETAWKDFRHLVVGKERLIQDTVIKLASADGKMSESETLDGFLEKAWKEARDDYNKDVVEPPDHIGRDYLLDPEGTIADGHSSDLEIFALDFLKDVPEIIVTHVHRHRPLYRHGANYQDQSEALAEIMTIKPRGGMDQLRMPKPINQKVSFNKNVAEHLRKVRANFLVPHINLTDLLDPCNLLTFIHHRARLVPSEFSLLDNDLSYLGRHSMILSGYFDCAVLVSLRVPSTNDDETESDQPLEVWLDYEYKSEGQTRDEQQQVLIDAGELFGTMEAFLILQSQTITYLFLGKLCAALLQTAQGDEAGHPDSVPDEDEEAEALQTIQGLRGNNQERWQDIASIRQYEPVPVTLNLDRYRQNIQSKRDRAEDHIGRLFNEPEYFFQQLLEQKEHHWVNVDISYDKLRDQFIEKYHQLESKRHTLYEDCLRSVLRRAVFEFFMWSSVEEVLVWLKGLEQDYPPHGQDRMVPSTHKDGAKTWPHTKWSTYDREDRGGIWTPYMMVQSIIRYVGVFFVLEFRNKAIHAASQPMRNIFCIKKAPEPRGIGDTAKFKRGHYNSDLMELGLTKKTLAEDRENLTRIVAELIENFISNQTSSMYMGMRKVTARLQRYLDDCDDEDTTNVFSTLVSDTIDSIDLLAELAEHLELHFPAHTLQMADPSYDEEKRREFFSRSLAGGSIDVLAFDDFMIEQIPEKRLRRLYQLLDQMQGFSINTINFGQARGDLKRLGSSLLHALIYKQNEQNKFQATKEALDRLAETMGVTRNQYPFDKKEQPMDMDKQENLPGRWPSDEWKYLRQQLLDDEKRRKKEGKKAWKQKGESSKDMNDPVANVQKRQEILQARRKKEIERWRRAQRRKKEKWRRRFAGAARPGGGAGAESQDDSGSEPEPEPAGNDDDNNAGNVAGGLQQPGIQNQPPAQRPLPQPQQPLPAHRQPGRQPGVQQLRLPAQPPARQLPPRTRATDISPPTPSLAPDGKAPGKLNKRVWETFRSIFGKSHSLVSWEELVRAMNAIGYQDEGRGGSHGVFLRTDGCRWRTEALPKAKNIQLAKYHGGSRKGAPRGKTLDWGTRLEQRGLTWGFFRQWYREKV